MSDLNDVCEGDEVNLTFDYPVPDNYSVLLNGTDEIIQVNHNAALDFGTTNFTVEFWFQASIFGNPAFLAAKTSAAGVGYAIGLTPTGEVNVVLNDGTTPITIAGTTGLNIGQWYHCAVTFDRAGLCVVYIDGSIYVQQSITGLGNISNADPIGFGGPAVTVGITPYLAGYMDEIRIWDRVLPVSEILSRMNDHINPNSQNGLVGYWDLNEGFGTLVIDCSPTAQDGGLVNAASFSSVVPTLNWSFGVAWSTGDFGNSIYVNPTDTTKFFASAGYCKYECMDSITINVLVCDSSESDFSLASVWVPNAFTPNGDTKNDVFEVKASYIEDYEIMIYNRFGNIVFHSKNITNSWDGTLDGTKVKDDVYSYIITYSNQKGEVTRKYGYVTVTR